MALAAAGLPALLLGWSLVGVARRWPLVALPGRAAAAGRALVEDRRAAVDRLVTALVWIGVRGRAVAAGLAALDGGQATALPAINARVPHLLDAQRRSATSRAASTTR